MIKGLLIVFSILTTNLAVAQDFRPPTGDEMTQMAIDKADAEKKAADAEKAREKEAQIRTDIRDAARNHDRDKKDADRKLAEQKKKDADRKREDDERRKKEAQRKNK